MLTLEPLTFNGEGNYALSNVLEFEVTDGFINLGEEVTKCQNRESYEECSTREFLKLAWEKCACTPFSLSHLNDTVGIIKVFQRFIRECQDAQQRWFYPSQKFRIFLKDIPDIRMRFLLTWAVKFYITA